MVSGPKIFTEASRHDILSTVNFPYFIYACIRSYQINNTNIIATRINSIESYTMVMDLKILSETKNSLTCFSKIFKHYFYKINYLCIKLDMIMHICLGFKVTSTEYEIFVVESSHSK